MTDITPAGLAITERHLLERFMTGAPFQPATNLWRCVELPVLAAVLPKAGRGLDVGCGDGVLTAILRDLVGGDWRLVGIDPDPAEVELAAASGQYERAITATADQVSEPDAGFDFAFANSVLEHIPNLSACLAEIARLLRPGGRFAATVPSPHFRDCLAGPDVTRRQTRAEYLDDVDRRLAHVNYWSADRWAAELRAAGLEPLPATPYLTRRQVRRWEAWSNWTGGLVHRLRGRAEAPIETQRRLGLRRGLPEPLRPLGRPLARLIGAGVLGRRTADPDGAGCLLVQARKAV
jgi:SAM-dependent methyltransferase